MGGDMLKLIIIRNKHMVIDNVYKFVTSAPVSKTPRPIGVTIIVVSILIISVGALVYLFASWLPKFTNSNSPSAPLSIIVLFWAGAVATIFVEGLYLIGFWRGQKYFLYAYRISFWGGVFGMTIGTMSGYTLEGLLGLIFFLPSALYLTFSKKVKIYFKGESLPNSTLQVSKK